MIYLAIADRKACFRFPFIHPDLTGAFGFHADGYYYLATATMIWIKHFSHELGTVSTSHRSFECSLREPF